jgi:HSP20 family protein
MVVNSGKKNLQGGKSMTNIVRRSSNSQLFSPFASALPIRGIFESFFNDSLADQSWATQCDTHLEVDVTESEDEYVLTANIPGVEAEDVSVKLEDQIVSISADMSTEDEDEQNGYLVRERRVGKCKRNLRLGSKFEHEKAKAVVKNGVLTLSIPKATESKPRHVEVEVI